MKNTKIILLVFGLMLLFTPDLLAHGKCRTRNSCNWTINEAWQYKAYARVTKFGWPSTSSDKDCPGVNGGDGFAGAYVNNGCAWQSATNNYGACSCPGSVYKKKRICARGTTSSEMYYDLVTLEDPEDEDYEQTEVNSAPVEFRQDNVVISDIQGYVEVMGIDLFSSYEVIMWLPNNEEDEEITAAKTFFQGKIELLNDVVTVSGGFPAQCYTVEELANGGKRVHFTGLSANGILPPGINGNDNLIEVVNISDGGVHEEGYVAQKLVQTNVKNDIQLTVSPNPTAGKVTVSMQHDSNSPVIVSAHVYDVQGKSVATVFENRKCKGNTEISIDLDRIQLPNGTYYLMVQSGSETYLKQVILSK